MTYIYVIDSHEYVDADAHRMTRAELAQAKERIAELERDAAESHEAIMLARGFCEGWNKLVARAESAEARVKAAENRLALIKEHMPEPDDGMHTVSIRMSRIRALLDAKEQP